MRGDRRPAARRLRRRARDGPLREARAADPAARRGGLGGALARHGRGLSLTGSQTTATFAAAAATPLGHGRWQAEADPALVRHRRPQRRLHRGDRAAGDGGRARPTRAAHPRSLTLHYTRPPVAGDVRDRRDGRARRAAAEHADRARRAGRASSACSPSARSARTSTALADYGEPAPDVPAPEDVEAVPQEHGAVDDRQALRHPARAVGPAPFGEADEALTGGWIALPRGRAAAGRRSRWRCSPTLGSRRRSCAPRRRRRADGRPDDPLPRARRAGRLAGARRLPLALRPRRLLRGGRRAVGADGRLLAQSRQLALIDA